MLGSRVGTGQPAHFEDHLGWWLPGRADGAGTVLCLREWDGCCVVLRQATQSWLVAAACGRQRRWRCVDGLIGAGTD
jgi:hypothetical protein